MIKSQNHFLFHYKLHIQITRDTATYMHCYWEAKYRLNIYIAVVFFFTVMDLGHIKTWQRTTRYNKGIYQKSLAKNVV